MRQQRLCQLKELAKAVQPGGLGAGTHTGLTAKTMLFPYAPRLRYGAGELNSQRVCFAVATENFEKKQLKTRFNCLLLFLLSSTLHSPLLLFFVLCLTCI